MTVRIFALLVLSCQILWAENFVPGHEVGANGDRVTNWFKTLGHHVHAELERREALGKPLDPRISSDDFLKALETDLVLVGKGNEALLKNMHGEVKDVKFVLLGPEKRPTILINQDLWTDLYLKKQPEYKDVFHAYLYAAHVDDRKYEVSWKLDLAGPTTELLPVFKRKLSLEFPIPLSDGGYAGVSQVDKVIRLDGNGIRRWTAKAAGWDVSLVHLLETKDGGLLASGRNDVPKIIDRPNGNRTESQLYLIKFDAEGTPEWKLSFCQKKQINPDKPYCIGEGIVSAAQRDDGSFDVLAVEGRHPVHSYLLHISSDGNRIADKIDYWPGIIILSMKQTKDGGYLFSGFTEPQEDKPRDQTPESEHFYIRKVRKDFSLQWERTLFGGRAWQAIELKSGEYLATGSRNLKPTSFPDLTSEPVLVRLSSEGRPLKTTSLYFHETEIDEPKWMGKEGRTQALFQNDDGTVYISGTNHVFERKKQAFYFATDGSRSWIEKNGFILRIGPDGKSRFKLFPNYEWLHLLPSSGSLVISGQRNFSKILRGEW